MAMDVNNNEIPKETESWIQKKWRPMMAVMYMCVCACDFILFPIMFTVVQFWEVAIQNDAFRQWAPLTLQGGGLFHMAMGAVLGITAWSRGQEKIAGTTTPTIAHNPQAPQVAPVAQTTPTPVAQPQPQVQISVGYGGKPAPTQPEYPPI